MRRFGWLALTLVVLRCAGSGGPPQPAPVSGGAAEEQYQGDPEWPRVIEDGDATFTIYQPQIDQFDNAALEARAAVQVEMKAGDDTHTTYGVVWITAQATIDKENKLVRLDDIELIRGNFPAEADKAGQYLGALRRNTEMARTISLARIEANLAITQADRKGNAVPLKNDPPKIYFRTAPALLVLIDGEPVLRPVEGAAGVERVINSRALILKTGETFFMPIADRWVTSSTPAGPWRNAASVPPSVQAIRDSIAKDENQSQVDLMVETSDGGNGVLASGQAPEIIVSTVPAELIVTQGTPQMKPVTGTQLLYVSNTSGDILLDLQSQDYYVSLTGRWFRSRSLEGPWQFVTGDQLPKDFARIPENDPKARVLATVPGTPAAQEAVIANSIPQTAEVNRDEAKFVSDYDGDPKFDAVPDTPLQYAVNSATPVVRVDATTYYAVQSGVWFTASSAIGPWVVATAVPPVIYTIPTSCPIHYITYVRVYRYSPTVVWVGYTPGYLGTCYSPWGTVVYGTGWYYSPWIGNYWYGSPWTWGFGAGIWWDPWAGWGWGFGWGGYRPYYNPWWGPYYGWRPRPPVYRPPYPGRPSPYRAGYRPRNWNDTNVYSRPGRPLAGVRPAVVKPVARPAAVPGRPGEVARPAPGGGPSTPRSPVTRPSRPDNVYAGPDGKVYRPQPGTPRNWETHDGGQWKPVEPSARPAPQPVPARPSQPEVRPQPYRPTIDRGTLDQLNREARGREAGNARMGPYSAPPPRAAPAPRSR